MHLPSLSISIVVPVYRSQETLKPLCQRLATQLEALKCKWNIILVVDASPDNSWSVACELHEADKRIQAIRLAHNHGQQHATLCGLNYATHDYVFTIDDDLQCSPEDIPQFLLELNKGSQVVIGRIATNIKQHSWWRNLGSRINQYFAGKILGKPQTLSLSSYRAMTRDVVQRIVAYKGAHPHIAALLLQSVPPAAIVNVDISHSKRGDDSNSSYSISKLIKTLSYLLINHSYIPLRMMSVWGFLISIVSLAYALWIIVHSIYAGNTTPGWASLAVLISFMSGNILFALGIVGEYLGRLVESSSQIAQFSIFEERL
ncbi:MAG: glycosyltransferase family 2 protein [Pusillimonas sp.]